jgi:uncharacterized protein (DUF1499 family)
MIHDVSTDAEDPPQFIALRETRLACRNGAHYSGGKHRHPGIEPQIFTQPRAQLFQAALATANTMQWHIAAAIEAEGRIEATATTRFMRFKDDVVIRLRPHESGTRLDIRSASRVGSSDFGANAKRIRTFLLELNNRLKTNT